MLATGSEITHGWPPLFTDPAGILAILAGVLAVIFWLARHPVIGRVFKIIPALVFCYFVPTTLATLKIIPHESPLYEWIKTYLLPASLLLLILALDIPGILRLGPKAIVMLLAGTTGVVLGGPFALWVCHSFLPEEAWRGMAALSGSWIGGGANFVAIGQAAKTPNDMLALMVIPDVLVANIWMGVLLFLAGRQEAIDRRLGTDTSAIESLQRRLTEFQKRVARPTTLPDLMMILAVGFLGAYACYLAGIEYEARLAHIGWLRPITSVITASTWKFILVTTTGLFLSLTPVRNLEGAGASKVGSVMLYLLVACIGASADFEKAWAYRGLLLMGFVWMAVHVTLLLTVGRLIRAPIFLIAVGSQANIGGAASAPVVASAFHPSLAPVGALLAVAGYVIGTYAGLICMRLLMAVAGVDSVT